MIHSSLIILYCLISIAGSIGFFFKKSTKGKRSERLVVLFFIACHVYFLTLGIMQFVDTVTVWWIIVAIILVFVSRISNGLVLFGKNNWRHYLVTGSLMGLIFILYLYDI